MLVLDWKFCLCSNSVLVDKDYVFKTGRASLESPPSVHSEGPALSGKPSTLKQRKYKIYD